VMGYRLRQRRKVGLLHCWYPGWWDWGPGGLSVGPVCRVDIDEGRFNQGLGNPGGRSVGE
jgi:hypothetical protein